jgi:ribose/xylose/arabinose/galactoside ABC-type transport system permease subunit
VPRHLVWPDHDGVNLVRYFLPNLSLAVVIAVMWAIIEFVHPGFLSSSNLTNIMRQASPLAVVAFGQALVIVGRGLDLSVGSIMGLVSVVTAIVGVKYGLAAGLLVGIAAGALCGAINGAMVSVFNVPAFVATLGMLSIARGLALTITGGATMDVPDGFSYFAWSNWGPLPVIAAIVLTIFVIGYGILELTTYGRRLYATGLNLETARLSGLSTGWSRFSTFVLSGSLAAVGAILLSSRMNSGNSLTGVGYELESIAAVVIGGVSLRGGEGSLLGVLLGALFLSSLSNGLRLVGFSSYLTLAVEGVVFIVAVWLNLRLFRR